MGRQGAIDYTHQLFAAATKLQGIALIHQGRQACAIHTAEHNLAIPFRISGLPPRRAGPDAVFRRCLEAFPFFVRLNIHSDW